MIILIIMGLDLVTSEDDTGCDNGGGSGMAAWWQQYVKIDS